MTWDPASKVPVHPSAAIFHASGPRFTKNSETIPWLPGGKNCVRSAIRSKRLVFPPIRLVASATAISNAGKNARKRLKAMAWEITPHRGNTRANIPYTRLRIPAAEIIARHYTCLSHSSGLPGSERSLDVFPHVLVAVRLHAPLHGPRPVGTVLIHLAEAGSDLRITYRAASRAELFPTLFL